MVVYIFQWKGIPTYDIDTHRNQPTNVFQREGYHDVGGKLQGITLYNHWRTSNPRGTGRACPMWRGKLNFDLNKNISRASLLLCKHIMKLHKSKTSNLKHETRMIYTQKRTLIKELTGWSDWEDVVWRGNHHCR